MRTCSRHAHGSKGHTFSRTKRIGDAASENLLFELITFSGMKAIHSITVMLHNNSNQSEAMWAHLSMKSINKPNNHASQLLQLPPELRLQIYSSLFATLPSPLE